METKPRAGRRTAAGKAAPRKSRTGPGDPNRPEDIRGAVARLKRERIIAAAVEVFYHQGYANTTLDDVAEAMHVTKTFIYAHFKSKHDLLAEICRRSLIYSHEAFTRAIEQRSTSTERLEGVAREFMLSLLGHQAHSVIYSREMKELKPEVNDAINHLRRDFDHRLSALIAEGVASGEFQVEDPGLAALSIIGIVAWSQFWFRPNGRLSREQVADRVARMVLSLVEARAVRPQAAPAAVAG